MINALSWFSDGGILSTVGNTPLVRLKRLFPDLPFELHGKLEMLNPGGSSKDRTGLSMLRDALALGKLRPGMTVIESSSGNLGIGLAQACAYAGLRFICVVDTRTTKTNLRVMEAYGAEIDMVSAGDAAIADLLTARIARVRSLCAAIPDSFWPNQYANLANARAQMATMREIYEALDGDVDYVFAATSTCGTLRGCSEFLTAAGATTKVIAVDAAGSVIFGGEKGVRLIPGHGASRVPELYKPGLEHRHIKVTDRDCVEGCYRLLRREAIFAGGSSGGVATAVYSLRGQIPPGARCVAILCDRGERYLDTVYSRGWVSGHFGDTMDRVYEPAYGAPVTADAAKSATYGGL
jgi:cysteine synthase A